MIKQKKKGSDFERLAVEILNQHVKKSSWRKIPGSGAIGTTLGEPILQGDISGVVDSFTRQFKGEAKVGYGGAKQLALKKEWLDKISEEAQRTNSIPFMVGKFSGARGGVQVFVAMDIGVFCELLNTVTELREELDKDG
jgi:hypothetical protein